MLIKRKKIFTSISILIFLGIFSYVQNNSIVVSRHIIKNKKIPSNFKGFKIVQISDLHSKVFGKNGEKLVRLINEENPDIIVITGDLVDRRRYNEENSMILIKDLKDVAPIYYVNGNHEAWSNKFSSLEKKLVSHGVKVLRNNNDTIVIGSQNINIIGVDDPAFGTRGYGEAYMDYDILKSNIDIALKNNREGYNILLSHRPELFSLYMTKGIDLTFSGHAHGGQVILPFVGGMVAPNQGFFPKYYKGMYTQGSSVMIVSRGLGNSIIPQRVFNRPEIVSVELVPEVNNN